MKEALQELQRTIDRFDQILAIGPIGAELAPELHTIRAAFNAIAEHAIDVAALCTIQVGRCDEILADLASRAHKGVH